MDQITLEYELAFANRQVARAERRIGDLRGLVFQLDCSNSEATKAIELLEILEKAQKILIRNRNDISKRLLLLREENRRN